MPQPSTDENPRRFPLEYETEVYQNDAGTVAIRQVSPFGAEDQVVVFSVDRIEPLINMLRAVKDEILTDRADEAELRQRPPLTNG